MLHFAELRARFERQMADYLADVGKRLREARLRNRPDLSSHEKAARELEKFGVTVTSKQYARWERGESEPRADKRTHIAEMLATTRDDIWGQPPIAPEEELRAQLDRIEQMLRAITQAMGIAEVSPAEQAAQAAEVAAQATEQQQAPSARKPRATRKKRAGG